MSTQTVHLHLFSRSSDRSNHSTASPAVIMPPSAFSQANVKSVLSGDTLIFSSVTNPKQERTLSLAFVSAPRMRRDGDEVGMEFSADHLSTAISYKAPNFGHRSTF